MVGGGDEVTIKSAKGLDLYRNKSKQYGWFQIQIEEVTVSITIYKSKPLA